MRKSKSTDPGISEEEKNFEQSLRPLNIKEFMGQQKITDNLNVFISAAKKREEALDHALLTGPPGLGKTTLAYIIANEMGVKLKVTSGPVLEKPGDLAGILTNLEEKLSDLQNQSEDQIKAAIKDAVAELSLVSTPIASIEYRRDVLEVLLRRSIMKLK